MHMVAHQAVAQQRQVVKLNVLPQQLQVNQAFAIRSEKELPRVTTLGDVVRDINDYNMGQTSYHSTKYQKTSRLSPVSRKRPVCPRVSVPGFPGFPIFRTQYLFHSATYSGTFQVIRQ